MLYGMGIIFHKILFTLTLVVNVYIHVRTQGFIQDFKLGGGNPCFVEARQTRGVWGHAPPENF